VLEKKEWGGAETRGSIWGGEEETPGGGGKDGFAKGLEGALRGSGEEGKGEMGRKRRENY